MASVGVEAALAERFYLGHEGAPALHHLPLDGLDEAGSRTSALILTSTLVLDGMGSESALCAAEGTAGGASSAADNMAASVAVLRTHAASRASTAACRAGSKRRVDDEMDDEASAPLSGPAVMEMSFHPEAGDLLLIRPQTPRSLSGGRVSITLWWQLSNAPSGQHDAAASAGAATSTMSITTASTASTTQPVSANANNDLASTPAIDPKSTPEVYDGTLSRPVRDALCAMPPVRFNVYDRSCPPCNAHEEVIESLLGQLGDQSRYIEYWGRALWRAVPAHSDLDEIPLLAPVTAGCEPPRPRFPLWAHVVYLDIASGVAAPTVLWDDELPHRREIFVIPAVPSRLLRFSGSWVHAVPKPAAEHLGEEQAEADELEEEARGGVLRHVLLFNSWPDAPPVGQPSRPAAGDTVIAAGNGVRPTSSALEHAVATATPFDQWRPSSVLKNGAAADQTPAVTSAAEDTLPSTTALVARLMGGPRRRGRSERYRCDALVASREAVYNALYEPLNPSSFCVQ